MTEIRLHIDEVVLRGFDPRQRYAIADAVQSELVRLFTESMTERPAGSPPTQPAEHRRLDAGVFDVPPGALPATTGASLAAAVHAAIEPLLTPRPSIEARDG